MSRLINADTLLEAIEDKEWVHITDYNMAFYAVKDAPTVDAVPVKHGEWKIRETVQATCSLCGFKTLVNQPGNGLHMVSELLYCPHCGARMDGDQ